MKVKEIRTKVYQLKNIFNMIRPYLRDRINDHKIQREWNVHSGNEVVDYKTEGEWKTQLTMIINFNLLKVLMKFAPCVQRAII